MELRLAVLWLVWAVGTERCCIGGASAALPKSITFQVYDAFDNVLHTNFSNENLARRYAVTFFNAINLVFQKITNPKIQFQVVRFHPQAQGVHNWHERQEGLQCASLGAPTACTPNFYQLQGNYKLFTLSQCAMSNITNYLTQLRNEHSKTAEVCSKRKCSRCIT
uniref:Hypothetical secreted protein n=1 Tax=Ornithodoros coriaceus TaxID=92741 RepID=B2D2A1_ORNCO|nr:hypothetical secreted protein [Ornithodoros coriaceus]